MAQPREEIADRSQQVGRTVSILDVGTVYLPASQMTVGIGNDVALAPVNLLARVIPPRTAAFRGLDPTDCRSPRPTGWRRGHHAPELGGPTRN